MTGPLAGRVVATTRDGDRNDPLTAALIREGATVREWPTLAFAEPNDTGPLRRALARLDTFDWVAFTSARAVPPVVGLRPWPGKGPAVAAVGERTADNLRARGWPVDLVGDGDGAAGLLRSWRALGGLEGARILYPAGSLARTELEEGVAAQGAFVLRVEAYQTLVCPPDPELVRSDLGRGVDVVIFTSPSAVEGLDAALAGAVADRLGRCAVVAAGNTTAAALAERKVERVVVAARPLADALVDACARAVVRD